MGNLSLSTQEFIWLMQTVADGWNEGNVQKAAGCFSEDAIYVEPPEKQLYQVARNFTSFSAEIRAQICL